MERTSWDGGALIVVGLVVLLEIRLQRGTPWPLALQPLFFVRGRVVVVKYPVGVFVERGDIACALVRESPDGDTADAVLALRILVLPADVVSRTRGEHFHLMSAGEPLRDQPTVILGAAKYFSAVALDDESDFHRCLVSS